MLKGKSAGWCNLSPFCIAEQVCELSSLWELQAKWVSSYLCSMLWMLHLPRECVFLNTNANYIALTMLIYQYILLFEIIKSTLIFHTDFFYFSGGGNLKFLPYFLNFELKLVCHAWFDLITCSYLTLVHIILFKLKIISYIRCYR